MNVRDSQQLDTIGSSEYESGKCVHGIMLPVWNVEVPLGN